MQRGWRNGVRSRIHAASPASTVILLDPWRVSEVLLGLRVGRINEVASLNPCSKTAERLLRREGQAAVRLRGTSAEKPLPRPTWVGHGRRMRDAQPSSPSGPSPLETPNRWSCSAVRVRKRRYVAKRTCRRRRYSCSTPSTTLNSSRACPRRRRRSVRLVQRKR